MILIINSLILNNIWNSRQYPIYWHYYRRYDESNSNNSYDYHDIYSKEKWTKWFNTNIRHINSEDAVKTTTTIVDTGNDHQDSDCHVYDREENNKNDIDVDEYHMV